MKRSRIAFHPQLGRWILSIIGIIVANPLLSHHVQAQGLEESIDAELDEALAPLPSSKKPSSNNKKKKDEKKNTQASSPSRPATSGPKSDPQPQAKSDSSEEELLLDEGEADLTADSGSGLIDDLQTESQKKEAPPLVSDLPPASPPPSAPAPPPSAPSRRAQKPPPVEPPTMITEPPMVTELPVATEPMMTTEPMVGDEPNIAFEQRVHRIFQRTGQPVSDAKWSELVGEHREEVYNIQAGDTLWDISQTFFGDGFFWSKLWAENSGIENPHRISVGKGLSFVAGTEADAPRINMTESVTLAKAGMGAAMSHQQNIDTSDAAPVYKEQARISQAELDAGDTIEEAEIVPQPVIPPPGRTSPVLKKLPPSFVSRNVGILDDYDSTGLDAPKQKAFTTPAVIIPNSYLAEASPGGIGAIEEIEAGEKIASVGQIVYVRLKRKAAVGDKVYAIFPRDMIKDRVRGPVGPVVEVGGILEIRDTINDEQGQYRAMVTYAVNPIRFGSVITDEPLPRTDFKRVGSKSDVEVRVLGGEFDETRKVLGEGAVIYLDGGSKSGLRAGDLLAIQSRRAERREDSKYPELRLPVATIKIVKVLPSVATAVILEANDEIRPGDKTGGRFPKPLEDLALDDAESGAAALHAASSSVSDLEKFDDDSGDNGSGIGGGGGDTDKTIDEDDIKLDD